MENYRTVKELLSSVVQQQLLYHYATCRLEFVS